MPAKLHSTISELETAFKNHFKGFRDNSGGVSCMMLFYAAECGVKMLWLFNNHGTSTRDIQAYSPDLLGKFGHDIGEWLKELRVGPRQIPEPPEFFLKRGGGSWAASYAHQAWRYHVAIHHGDEHRLIDWLEKVCAYVRKEMK